MWNHKLKYKNPLGKCLFLLINYFRMEIVQINRSNSTSKRNSFISAKATESFLSPVSDATQSSFVNKNLSEFKIINEKKQKSLPSEKYNQILDTKNYSNLESEDLNKSRLFDSQNLHLKKIRNLYLKLVFENFFKKARFIQMKDYFKMWNLKLKKEVFMFKVFIKFI